jgi:hypothetical protein
LLLIPTSLFSAEIHGFVEIGRENFHERFYTDMEIRVEFNIYSLENTIYGGNQIWATLESKPYGSPFLDIYRIGYKAQIDKYYIKIEHSCGHPVWSTQNSKWWNEIIQLGQNFTVMTVGVEF